MEKRIAEEIIACLPRGRTFFYYFKDRYALMLLSYVVGDGMKVADLKCSPYAGLLSKPPVKQALAAAGSGMLTAQVLDACWPVQVEPFLLTLTIWGSQRARDRTWHQTTRCGYNLVLQLNFSQKHDEQYRRLIKPKADDIFNFSLHPVMKWGGRRLFRDTLAWARIDLDFDQGEALIEEIQSDWISYAQETLQRIRWARQTGRDEVYLYGIAGSNDAVTTYVNHVLRPYAKLWDEAMLAATIMFIRDELGLHTIYYHSFDTGIGLKGMQNYLPPRALYTSLPRRFCFRRTKRLPVFLSGDKSVRKSLKRMSNPYWFELVV